MNKRKLRTKYRRFVRSNIYDMIHYESISKTSAKPVMPLTSRQIAVLSKEAM